MNFREALREDALKLIFVFMSFLMMVLVSCLFVAAIVERHMLFTANGLLDAAEANIHLMLREGEPSMGGIRDFLDGFRFETEGYGVLMDENLILISHPNEAYIGRSFGEFSKTHARTGGRLKAGAQEVTGVKIVIANGERVNCAFRRMSNGWYVGFAMPLKSYYRDAYSMAAVLSVMGLTLTVVLGYFMLRLSMERIRSDEENRSKTSFLARMSHEIRTPMNAMLGMAELIMRKNVADDVRENVSLIAQSGNTLLAIINDILDFSKIESGRLQIESKNYFFASLINDLVSTVRLRLAEKGLAFTVRVDCDIPAQLTGDEARVRQILTNILNNAVKYTHSGFVSLDVRMRSLGEGRLELAFDVADSGVGIRDEDKGKLFQDFTRLDLEHNHEIEGTGLGLVIAKSLCLCMEGDIAFSSEYGKGSVFTVTIVQGVGGGQRLASLDKPGQSAVILEERDIYADSALGAMRALGLVAERAENLAAFIRSLEAGAHDYAFVSSERVADCLHALGGHGAKTRLVAMVEMGGALSVGGVFSVDIPLYSATIANALNGACGVWRRHGEFMTGFTAPSARILIVDDISTNLSVAKGLMEPYGMDIHICSGGRKAIEMAGKNRYDLVFMDHMMPDIDGLAAAAAIRANENARGTPIVMLTANAVSGQREMFLQNGIDDFLSKPIDTKALDDILARWIPREKQLGPADARQAEGGGGPGLEIEGLDVAAGLRNCGGSAAVYMDILSDFCRDAAARAPLMRQSAGQGDVGLCAILAHALKGASRSIGAADFAGLAAVMEEAGRAKDIDFIRDNLEGLIGRLGALTDAIGAALSAADECRESAGCAGILELGLESLRAALKDMDIKAVNDMLIGYVEMPIGAAAKREVGEIEQHILMFEYEKAISKIDMLLERAAG
ncbi:MAG: response regulator [Clostridiales Family XIII bacterium]|jgi:signal transduction histidine kinase/CheY-like chemotaxis protein|nr:response regulator [Clostridiales Family XIII bacterium]